MIPPFTWPGRLGKPVAMYQSPESIFRSFTKVLCETTCSVTIVCAEEYENVFNSSLC